MYKLLLQIDLLGNPLALARGLGAGVKDFFTLTAEGLDHIFDSPEMFVRNLGKGTWSLTRSVGAGFFKVRASLRFATPRLAAPRRANLAALPSANLVAHPPRPSLAQAGADISSSIGRSMATFSFDPKYVRARETASAHHAAPRHIGQGLLSGAWALATGVGDGLMGVVTAPIEGAKKEGATGMLKGFGRGGAGLLVKPIAGAFDLFTRTLEGGANTFDWLAGEDVDGTGREGEMALDGDVRMRPPRMMHGVDRALRAYSRSEAIAHRVLCKLREGLYSTDTFLLCILLPASTEVLVLTHARLIIAQASSYKTTEHLPLALVHEVKSRQNARPPPHHHLGLRLHPRLCRLTSRLPCPCPHPRRCLLLHCPPLARLTSPRLASPRLTSPRRSSLPSRYACARMG